MAKNGCGQFIAVATIYSSDAFNNSYAHNGFLDSSKKYKSYTATSNSSVNSKSSFTEFLAGCECAPNYSAKTNGTYQSSASSNFNITVDQYGSIIIKNEIESSANTSGSDQITDNLATVYCAPIPSAYSFTQNGSIKCTNNNGRTAMECKSECTTTQTSTSSTVGNQGKTVTPKTTSSSNNDPCTAEAPFVPDTRFFTQETDENETQKYKYENEINHSWMSDTDCSQGQYNFKDKRSVERRVSGEVDLESAQNTRRQAISKRLDIYQINAPQNQKGDICKNVHISPDSYDCWDFSGIDQEEYLYVEEILYSWIVRFKPYVLKEGLPIDVDEFKGTLHAYAVPALFDEYGDAYPDPEYGLSNCTCGSEIGPANGELSPFLSLPVSVQRDGEVVNGDTIVGSNTVDMGSDQSPTQQSFSFYCVEDTTFRS